MPAVQDTVDQVKAIDVSEYKYGFVTDIDAERAPKGLNEDIVRFISDKKAEPAWLTEWRLEAYRRWQTMESPDWSRVKHPPIDYQDLHYFSAPRARPARSRSTRSTPNCLRTYEKLGIPLRRTGNPRRCGAEEQRVAVDAVFDSVSVVTTFKEELEKGRCHFLLRSPRRCA